jgi:hypothetical protein
MKKFSVHLQSDNSSVTISTNAETPEKAIKLVCLSENAPESAVKKVTTLVQAQYLNVGDKISTGIITTKPYAVSNTPARKVWLGVDGYRKEWNKTTEISVTVWEKEK